MWPDASLHEVRDSGERGRGLFATRGFAAGSPVLCEAALASSPLPAPSLDASSWRVAASLARVLLERGLAGKTRGLEPRSAVETSADAEEAEEVAALREAAAAASEPAEEARRLLHVVARNAFALLGEQALCPRAAMINHSCSPNATQTGFRTPDGALCVCVRAVTAIEPGEEVVISYVADLTAPPAERALALAPHPFGPTPRGCDRALEEWLVAEGEARYAAYHSIRPSSQLSSNNSNHRTDPPLILRHAAPAEPLHQPPRISFARPFSFFSRRAAAEPRLRAMSDAADAAWEAAHAAGDEAERRRQLMTSAAHYGQLLQLSDGLLGAHHTLLLVARGRLAHVMTVSGAQRSCANALPLWRSHLAATRRCCPPNWPHLLPCLRGGRDAAARAGDSTAAAEFEAELHRVLDVLKPKCLDVTGGPG